MKKIIDFTSLDKEPCKLPMKESSIRLDLGMLLFDFSFLSLFQTHEMELLALIFLKHRIHLALVIAPAFNYILHFFLFWHFEALIL